jgi:hypothetical protein
MHLGLYILFIALAANNTNAQQHYIDENGVSFSFDEVPVTIEVDGKWSFQATMIITNSNVLYINVVDVFKELKIVCNESSKDNRVTGFIMKERRAYLIDYSEKKIQVGDALLNSKEGLLEENGIKYIESSILSTVFGLTLTYNPRLLSAKLVSSFELPYAKQMRIASFRNSISKLQGKTTSVDTLISRDYHLLKFGTLDWAVSSIQNKSSTATNNVILGIGSELLFGEANVSLNYNDNYKFDYRQLQYNWRWVDNNRSLIKQVQVGKIFHKSIAFLGSPLLGVTVNNSPNTVRKASGSYTISDYTEPNWTVELYINDILVDYTATDAVGLYVFTVPIVYGYTTLKLKFYGPLGEERTEQRIINTPYTYLPINTLAYSVVGGILQDGKGSQYGQAALNYGFGRFFSLGGGLEYLSSIADRPLIPFAKAVFQPFSQMILNFEYAYGVRMRGSLDYYITKNAFLQFDYTKYKKGELVTRFNALEEAKIEISTPFKTDLFSGFSKLKFNQFVYESFKFNQIDFTFSSYYKQLSINSSILANWIGKKNPFISNKLSLAYRLRRGLVLRSSAEYNLRDNTVTRLKTEIEKRFSQMYLSASYERTFASSNNAFFLNVTYNLPFARAGVSSLLTNKKIAFSENIQGSLAFGGGNNYIHSDSNSAVGKGGILFYPFLDLNENGILDNGEKMVLLPSVKISGGTAVISEKDSIVRVSGLNAFVSYIIEFSNSDLQNISWKFKNNSYQVLVNPNQYKRIFVPIVSSGEVNGTVYLSTGGIKKGQGRIVLQIFDSMHKKVAETVSESDGYYSYLGLKLGNYRIRLEDNQLEKLNYQAKPQEQEFVVNVSEEGTIVDRLDFTMMAKETQQLIIKAKEMVKEQKKLENTFVKPIEYVFNMEALSFSFNLKAYKEGVIRKELRHSYLNIYKRVTNATTQYCYGFLNTKEIMLFSKKTLPSKEILGTSIATYPFRKKNSPFKSTFQKEKERENSLIIEEAQIYCNFNTSYRKIEEEPGLFYSVQIGVFNNYIPSKYLLNFEPVFYHCMADGSTKYISGKYNSKNEAKIARNKIIKKGVEDAYIVKYNHGKKVNTALRTE